MSVYMSITLSRFAPGNAASSRCPAVLQRFGSASGSPMASPDGPVGNCGTSPLQLEFVEVVEVPAVLVAVAGAAGVVLRQESLGGLAGAEVVPGLARCQDRLGCLLVEQDVDVAMREVGVRVGVALDPHVAGGNQLRQAGQAAVFFDRDARAGAAFGPVAVADLLPRLRGELVVG